MNETPMHVKYDARLYGPRRGGKDVLSAAFLKKYLGFAKRRYGCVAMCYLMDSTSATLHCEPCKSRMRSKTQRQLRAADCSCLISFHPGSRLQREHSSHIAAAASST